MEILIKRHQTLVQVLKTLDEILKDLNTESPYHKAFRDSTIQRFEYCADIFWKTLKDYLILALGTSPEGSSPKKVFTACVTAQVITPEEHKICNSLVEDRNITSHSYNEDLAEEICTRIPQYYLLMQTVADRIASSIMLHG